jgi:hypothetical protein
LNVEAVLRPDTKIIEAAAGGIFTAAPVRAEPVRHVMSKRINVRGEARLGDVPVL